MYSLHGSVVSRSYCVSGELGSACLPSDYTILHMKRSVSHKEMQVFYLLSIKNTRNCNVWTWYKENCV